MQGVGNQVIVAICLLFAPIFLLLIYYWKNIKQLYLRHIAPPDNPLNQPEDRQNMRRQRNDNTCSICLIQPKRYQVSSTCGHSYCGQCIFQLFDRTVGRKIKCPLCRNQMSVLFQCFNNNQRPQNQQRQVIRKIRQYNILFDDSRPFLRRILQFPYVLKRIFKNIFSLQFLFFFLRNAYFMRLIFTAIFYLILPIDILPQRFVGLIGFVDDLFMIVLLLSYFITIVGIQYYRAYH